MNILSKKGKMVIAASLVMALVMMATLPYVGYAEEPPELHCKTPIIAKARGVAIQKVNDETIKLPVKMTLICEKLRREPGIIWFKVLNGTVNIDGTAYTISEGSGVVLILEHQVFAVCKGSGPNGETVALRLTAKYLWMWGHLYVGRVRGIIKIGEDTKMLLLLRGATKIP